MHPFLFPFLVFSGGGLRVYYFAEPRTHNARMRVREASWVVVRLPFVEVEIPRLAVRTSAVIISALTAPLITGQKQVALYVPSGGFLVKAS